MSTKPRTRKTSTAMPTDLMAERDIVVRRLESELNDLAGLYVASSQLSCNQSARAVVRHLCELLEQLIGVQSFGIYVLTVDGLRAVPIATRGRVDAEASLSAEDRAFGNVCLTGVAEISDPSEPRSAGRPLAVLPLNFDDEVIGVITIVDLFPHKPSWANIDRELFKLVSSQGAAALVAANLYESAAGARRALADLHENLQRAQGPSDPGSLVPKGNG